MGFPNAMRQLRNSIGRRPGDAPTYRELLLYRSAVDTNIYDRDILPVRQFDVFRYEFTKAAANPIGIVFHEEGIHGGSLHSELALSFLDVIRLSLAKRMKQKERIQGDAILFCHALYANYYHFMLECLPRLFCLRTDLYDDSACIVMPAVRSSFHSQWLDIIGLESHVRNVDVRKIIVAERMIVCSFQASSGNHNQAIMPDYGKWLLDRVRVARKMKSLSDASRPSKIFVGRKAGRRRALVNMDEVTNVLRVSGYVYVELDDLSIYDQVSIFFNADSIVAIHGAALANILFCREKTKIIELINKEFHYYTFSKLSRILNLDHRRVRCEPTIYSDDPAVVNHCDIIVDCGELRRAI